MDLRSPDHPSALADRRWPPLAAGVTAIALVFSIFPNPFRPPPQNPNAQPELASKPVDAPNFSETALVESGGLGSGGTEEIPPELFDPADGGPIPLQQFRPRQKECVGSPPRQTEDPLSPPCVPFFDGDNGGKTFRGVTGSEIRVVLYNDWGVTGDMTTPYRRTDEPSGSFNTQLGGNIVRTIKAHLRYFQRRFQTYGRTVRVIAAESQGFNTTCPQRQADATVAFEDHTPFAAVDLTNNGRVSGCFAERMSGEHGAMTFGTGADQPPEIYTRNAPLAFGFYPDQQVEADLSASFVCRALADRPARFATDPALRDERRVFGLLIPSRTNTYYYYDEDNLAKRFVKLVRARCGLEVVQRTFNDGSSGNNAGTRNDIIALRDAGVTTVICHCSGGQIRSFQRDATDSDYRPEWYFDHGSSILRPNQAGSLDTAHAAFGITHFWNGRPLEEQHHYRAYRSEEPDSEPNRSLSFDVYYQFLNLFSGIQAAGSRLTPGTVRDGMFTFRYNHPDDPWLPTGGYGQYIAEAVGDYSFIDTAVAWWYDREGDPDEGPCTRFAADGTRFFPGTWPARDGLLFDRDSSVCAVDLFGGGGGGPFGFGP